LAKPFDFSRNLEMVFNTPGFCQVNHKDDSVKIPHRTRGFQAELVLVLNRMETMQTWVLREKADGGLEL
jgi:hypothetical protein